MPKNIYDNMASHFKEVNERVIEYEPEDLEAKFEDNPRVTFDDTPRLHKYYQHGKQLLGFHHGHETPPARAWEVMAYDCIDILSQTEYRDYQSTANQGVKFHQTQWKSIEDI